MSTLSGALDLANAGEYVFPCIPNGKKPLVSDWENVATNDGEQVLRWASEFPGCNWGWAVGRTNRTAIDLDVKNPKENGVAWWREHQEKIPETWTQKTPSGGYHLVFAGLTRTTKGILAPGVDTRSKGGYILCPESTIGKYSYRRTGGAPFAPIPPHLAAAIGLSIPQDTAHDTCLTDWDQPENVQRAAEYLDSLQPVPEGDRNNACLHTALAIRDLGVSYETCRDLMETSFLPLCDEGDFGFDATVRSAYKTAKLPAGTAAADVLAEKFTDPPNYPDDPPPANWVLDCGTTHRLEIPRRQWVLGRRYMAGQITVTVAPGGIGKSTLTILEALSVRTGRSLTGMTPHVTGPVWIYSTEEPRDELLRRVHAAAAHHGITDLSGVYVSSGRDDPLILAKNDNGAVVINKAAVQRVIDQCLSLGIVLLVIDPFVRTHLVNENDNSAIDKVTQALQRIASLANVALSLVHHTSKAGANAAGDMHAARGASSLIAACRIAHTLVNATEAELKILKAVTEADQKRILRLDDAKANMSPPGANTTWFRRVSVRLGQGDDVGTLETLDARPREIVLTTEDRELIDKVTRAYVEPITAYNMAKVLRRDYGDERSQETIRRAIVRVFDFPQAGNGRILQTALLKSASARRIGIVEVEDEYEF